VSAGAETMQLRAERPRFVMAPEWVFRAVSDGALRLYCELHSLVNGREGPTRPVTRAQLGEACGVSVDTVDRRLAELVGIGAVEKQAQVPAGGQVANVYQVWLTPPAGYHRIPVGERDEPVDNRSRKNAAAVGGDAKAQVNRSRKFAAAPWGVDAGPQRCGDRSREFAAPTVLEDEDQELPPQPPRRAGGPNVDLAAAGPASRRLSGASLRAVGANPRAEAARLEADRRAVADAASRADLDAETEARRCAESAAAADAERFEAEALALSAVLDDEVLAAVVDRAGVGLAGPLARSPLALSRAVVGFCRGAAATRPGGVEVAVAGALAGAGPVVAEPEGGWPSVPLPAPPAGTAGLQDRIRTLLHRAGGSSVAAG